MIYNTLIGQPLTTRELTVFLNGEYYPSTNNCDAFSKVTVKIKQIKLSTPVIIQYSNYVAVIHDNGVWANKFDFFVNGVLTLTTEVPYADLRDLLAEGGSGEIFARVKYSEGMVGSSDFSNTINCAVQPYAECVVELHEPVARVLRLAEGVNPIHVNIPPYALIEGKFFPIAEIGEGAFANNSTMESVGGTFIEKIYEKAFKGCSSLKSINFPYLKEMYGKEILAGTDITELKLNGVSVFYSPKVLNGNVSISTVKLPVTEYYDAILPSTFEGAKLNYLFAPSNVKRIDENAFKSSTLKYLEIETEGVEISKNAFVGSTLATSEGFVFVKYADLSTYLSDDYSQTFGNLACTIDLEYQEVFQGTQTIAGKTCKFRLFNFYSDLIDDSAAINDSGENWTSEGNLKLYAKITIE